MKMEVSYSQLSTIHDIVGQVVVDDRVIIILLEGPHKAIVLRIRNSRESREWLINQYGRSIPL